MKVFELNRELWLPRQPEEIFPFFAEAENLEKLTPPWLSFQILTPLPIEIKKGTLIDYRLGIHGIPLLWRTEISQWQPPGRFVDRQLRGPYRLWEHEHTFQAKDGGTLLGDHVKYSVLGGWLVDRLLVRRDVKRIFDYRQEQMQRLFGGEEGIRSQESGRGRREALPPADFQGSSGAADSLNSKGGPMGSGSQAPQGPRR